MFPELTVQVQQRRGLAGARVRLAGRWGVRGEIRLRPVDPWSGHTADFDVGFTHSSF